MAKFSEDISQYYENEKYKKVFTGYDGKGVRLAFSKHSLEKVDYTRKDGTKTFYMLCKPFVANDLTSKKYSEQIQLDPALSNFREKIYEKKWNKLQKYIKDGENYFVLNAPLVGVYDKLKGYGYCIVDDESAMSKPKKEFNINLHQKKTLYKISLDVEKRIPKDVNEKSDLEDDLVV